VPGQHTLLHPSAIGPLSRLSLPIPHWSARSAWLLYNQLPFCARLTHHPDDGDSAPPKRRSTSIWLHSSISQKTLNLIFATVRTWNLTCHSCFCLLKTDLAYKV
jgi:hypothetical protein